MSEKLKIQKERKKWSEANQSTHPYPYAEDNQKVNHNNGDVSRIVDFVGARVEAPHVGKPTIFPSHRAGIEEERTHTNTSEGALIYALVFVCARACVRELVCLQI